MDPKDAPAFPSSSLEIDSRNMGWLGGGMTLRDYFAAKAMQGFCTQPPDQFSTLCNVAAQAYLLVDAMLAERDK